MHTGMTPIPPDLPGRAPQAAAEYVGTALSSALRSVGDGLGSLAARAGENPLLTIAVVGAILFLLRILRRR